MRIKSIAGVNCAWAGDITYIPTTQGWLYLAVVLHLKSRKVIGWSMAPTLEQSLVQQALSMAIGQRLRQATGGTLLFHSDRGRQYAAQHYQQQFQAWEIRCSMSFHGQLLG